ncbi:hypothetical protein GCM10011614_28350 [Novosphingobium colocasiae]|uniref:Uncharacterized protein n=1 Tax=Novosphingobium colocasiae TaxID=1256513 RepID=A0A918UHA7_9SPHN|nr:hypothetical protein GCM10011614_28350 [Novosphingobium colocasiae]
MQEKKDALNESKPRQETGEAGRLWNAVALASLRIGAIVVASHREVLVQVTFSLDDIKGFPQPPM